MSVEEAVAVLVSVCTEGISPHFSIHPTTHCHIKGNTLSLMCEKTPQSQDCTADKEVACQNCFLGNPSAFKGSPQAFWEKVDWIRGSGDGVVDF